MPSVREASKSSASVPSRGKVADGAGCRAEDGSGSKGCAEVLDRLGPGLGALNEARTSGGGQKEKTGDGGSSHRRDRQSRHPRRRRPLVLDILWRREAYLTCL